ncbi:MAG: hypothetical protein AB1779_07850 [Candidatus Thermoplasmatota archaeon]
MRGFKILLTIFLLFHFLQIDAVSEEKESIVIDSPENSFGNIGEKLNYTFNITYNGPYPTERLKIVGNSSNNWVVDVMGMGESYEVRVYKNKTIPIRVSLQIPNNALAYTIDGTKISVYTYNVLIGNYNPLPEAVGIVYTYVNKSQSARILAYELKAKPMDELEVIFNITNEGNCDEEFNFSIESSLGWNLSFPSKVKFKAFERKNITAVLSVPENAKAGIEEKLKVSCYFDNVSINATSVIIIEKVLSFRNLKPEEKKLSINETEELGFSADVFYNGEGNLLYKWYINGNENISKNNTLLLRTDYASAGIYNIELNVSDGDIWNSIKWNLIINNVNREPKIIRYTKEVKKIYEDEKIEFLVDAEDLDGDELSYTWYIDGLMIGNYNYSYYKINAKKLAIGKHNLYVLVSDGESNVTKEWSFEVAKRYLSIPSVLVVSIISLLILIIILFEVRKRKKVRIEEIFLIYKDGRLIEHCSRRLKPKVDALAVSGMLTAIQNFINVSFGTREKGATELEHGGLKILLEHGKNSYLAVVSNARKEKDVLKLRKKMTELMSEIDKKYSNILEDWDGRESSLIEIKKLVSSFVWE